MTRMILSDFARKKLSSLKLKITLLDTVINIKTIIFNKFLNVLNLNHSICYSKKNSSTVLE